MAKGQEIDKLYLSLGLNIDDLKLGFNTANKTVQQAITRLNSDAKKIKLQTDIDLSKLQGVGSELDKIRVKYEAINKQLDIQRQKESILNAQYKHSLNTHGADSAVTQRAQMALLNQQKTVAGMEAEMRKLGNALNTLPSKSNKAFSAITKGASQARQGIGKLTEGYTLLNAKLAAFLAVAGSGAGLLNITKDSMMAGNNLYKLQQRLNVSTQEASQLNRVFSLAGTSINSLTPFITRIDKQLETAGQNGNNTTKALERFGISLTNQHGQLLPINQQLEQLAKGYKSASEAGEVEAFTAEILGARGSALIPVLEEYNELMAVSGSIKTTGLLNPQEAHETYLEWQRMQAELSQLEMAFGAALLPVAKEMMPELTEGFTNLVELIAENKDNIKTLGEIMIQAMKGAGEAVSMVADGLDMIGINARTAGDYLKDVKAEFDAGYGALLMGPGMSSPATGFLLSQRLRLLDDVKDQRKLNDETQRAKQAEKEYYAEIDRRTQERKKQIDQESRAQRAQAEQTKQQAEALEALHESLYSLNHTDLETQLHNVDKSMKQWKEKGVSEAEITKATEQQKAEIIKKFNQEVAQNIDSVWKSAYQNRLEQIEREKEAWKQKGLEEVKATKWAEEQKRQLQQETALSMFKENYKYLKLYRTAMAGGGSQEQKQANAMNAVLTQLRKDADLPSDAWTTPQEIAGFQQLMKSARENIIPIYNGEPQGYIYKGTQAVPMFPPDYNESVSKLGNNSPAPVMNKTQEDINYNLYVHVDGLQDVSNEVAQSAAKKILDVLPNDSNINMSYGG
ncbi:hypothetical protein D081_1802 [Anaerovibrio sp. JC8]|uniref:hypothetical protein n=1 Tax=Anaerovibrio sp. JC8 TaxID=1240085 RepID=UPI000A09AA4A|nr:hypothetical protein [Anaerovibrio sp. JC8]ORT99652.1 hypothetical protein D081_1802 [Anaerovibrio sp. JC8]